MKSPFNPRITDVETMVGGEVVKKEVMVWMTMSEYVAYMAIIGLTASVITAITVGVVSEVVAPKIKEKLDK